MLGHMASVFFVVLADEVLRQGQDVLPAIAQGRQFDRHDRQPVVKILAKHSLTHCLF